MNNAAAPLAWENQSEYATGHAFRATLQELLLHPRRFYAAMATDGGLHEPLTFLVILLTAAVVLGFGASLACAGVMLPPADQTAHQQFLATLPVRASGIALALLPEALILGAVGATVTGTLFFWGARLFGAQGWEASVSIVTYAISAALAPLVLAFTVILLVAGSGFFVSIASPNTADMVDSVTRLTVLIALFAGGVCAIGTLPFQCAIGCTQTFGLDPVLGVAAAASGSITAALLPVTLWVIGVFVNGRAAFVTGVLGIAGTAGLAAWQMVRAGRSRIGEEVRSG